MCYVDDVDSVAEFYTVRKQRAKKDHPCAECGRTIRPGETYERVDAKWDGELARLRTCPHCIEARIWLREVCGGWIHGVLAEDLREHISERHELRLVRPLAFIRLVKLMERKWQHRGRLVPPGMVHDLALAGSRMPVPAAAAR